LGKSCLSIIGTGPKPIIREELSAKRLAAAISEAICSKETADNAHRIGEKLRAEDGVGNAVKIIEKQ